MPPPIRIKLDIEIPHGASVELTEPGLAVRTPRAPGVIGGIDLIYPSNPAKVVLSSGSAAGEICVRVRNHLNSDGDFPLKVWIVFGTTPATFPGGTPTISPTSKDWQIDRIGLVACGSGSSNGITIWSEFPSGERLRFFFHPFAGVCAAQTDCEAEVIRQARKTLGSSTVAKRWVFEGVGFTGQPVEEFNRNFTLDLAPDSATDGNPTDWKWSNGACGPAKPRVELTVPRCGCGPCLLRLTIQGVAVRYSLPSGEWNSIGRNQFVSVRTEGLPNGCEVPASPEVRPA